MKVSLNEVKKFADVNLSVEDLVQKIGAQLGAVETVERAGEKYSDVIVAKVVSCEKHPNADKLSACMIDDGGAVQDIERTNGLVQVVCGAPNVRVGILVAWLPPGSTVPSTHDTNEPFVLGSRELRGIVSNGMLASPSELAISDNHDGILEIDEDVKPGTEFKTLYGIDDVIIEIENKMFTHRPDCFGVLGVAREIAGINGTKFTSPEWYLKTPEFDHGSTLPLEVENQLPELCPRFMAVAMDNVSIKSSPIWLQAILTRVGIKPINNVVDVTNYLSYITAQPLHVYDYDKVKALSEGTPKLIVRKPKSDEQIALLNGKTISPREDAIMIATDKESVGIAGVMGGTTTEVDETTRKIIIEVASFDMYSIRRTSMAHGLFTDAVTRFNKGQSLLQNDRVIAQAMKMMTELSGAQQASSVQDIRNIQPDQASISITKEFINARLGTDVTSQDIMTALDNVEFEVKVNDSVINVTPPFWRTDVVIKEDIVEEVGRLLGYDKLPLELPTRTVSPTDLDPMLSLKRRLRSTLSSYGANEVLSYSFVHGKLIDNAGQDKDLAFKLSNALSPNLQYYRLSLTPSLLDKIHPNIKSGFDNFALFEIGKVHSKSEIDEDNAPSEFGRVSFVYSSKTDERTAYYQAVYFLNNLNKQLKLVPFDQDLLQDHQLITQMTAPYDKSRSALVLSNKGYVVGIVGEFTPQVLKKFKLPTSTAGFEMFLSAFKKEEDSIYRPLSKFPSLSQDICLEIEEELSYGTLTETFDKSLSELIELNQAVHTEVIDIYSSDDLGKKKRVTYRVKLISYERTLTENVLGSILEELCKRINQKISVKRI